MPGTSLTFATAQKWLFSAGPANEKAQTFEKNCFAVLPAREKAFCRLHFSDGSFFVPPSCNIPGYSSTPPPPPPLSPLAYLSFYLSPSPSLTNTDNSAGLIAPSGLTDGINTFFSQKGSRRPRRILNGAPGCVGCRLSRRCFV